MKSLEVFSYNRTLISLFELNTRENTKKLWYDESLSILHSAAIVKNLKLLDDQTPAFEFNTFIYSIHHFLCGTSTQRSKRFNNNLKLVALGYFMITYYMRKKAFETSVLSRRSINDVKEHDVSQILYDILAIAVMAWKCAKKSTIKPFILI